MLILIECPSEKITEDIARNLNNKLGFPIMSNRYLPIRYNDLISEQVEDFDALFMMGEPEVVYERMNFLINYIEAAKEPETMLIKGFHNMAYVTAKLYYGYDPKEMTEKLDKRLANFDVAIIKVNVIEEQYENDNIELDYIVSKSKCKKYNYTYNGRATIDEITYLLTEELELN